MALSGGARLGPYEILSVLGTGGMGEVYRARDTKLNRDVAIKVLLPAVANDPDRLARFRREAQVLASLNHPNIAAIYGLEDGGDVRALVMELVDGPTLADRIAKGPVPLDEALPIGKQIAEALEAAHEQGIMHRDLKPANIKVRDDGTVKVLDFGLAKAMEPVGSRVDVTQSPTITSPAMTQAGIILGTAAYMSPEQAKGRAVDKRSDLWAFGAVLFEMLTGRRAFGGEDVSDTLAHVLMKEPDWTALSPDTPAPIRKLLRRCLEKNRKQRLDSAADARLEIDDALTAPVESTASSPPQWRQVIPVVLGVVLTAALASVAWWRFRPEAAPTIVTRFTFRLPEGQRFTNLGRHGVALSPDGTHMAYVANQRLYLKAMWESEATPITGTMIGGVTSPVFSPDGQWIAYWSAQGTASSLGSLNKMSISGGAAIKLCDVENPSGISWASDSLYFGGSKGVQRVSDQGGSAPELIIPVKESEIAHGPQLLPGGRSVLFTLATATGPDRWDKAQIVVQTPGSTERKTLIRGGADARYIATGHLVYALGGALFAEPFDVRRLEALGGPISVVEGVGRSQSGQTGSAQVAVATTGALMYVPGPATMGPPGYYIALVDRNGAINRIKLPPRAYQAPRFSPSGQQLAYDIDDGPAANIWVYDLAGNHDPRQLTFEGSNRFPIWTHDGQRLAFQSDREGDAGIFWQQADGNSGRPDRLTKAKPGEAHIPESWSRDGDTLLFSSRTRDGQFLLSAFTLHDKKIAPFDDVRSSAVLNSAFSPDGRWIAYAAQLAGASVVFVRPFPLTDVRYRIGEGINPFWAPDGKTLYFVSTPGSGVFSAVNITTEPSFAASPASSVPRPLITGGAPNLPRAYDVAPDNQQFVVLTGATANADPQIQFVLNWTEELKQRVRAK
jgi:eukaryotic-like serine/threonine-protein kinase